LIFEPVKLVPLCDVRIS